MVTSTSSWPLAVGSLLSSPAAFALRRNRSYDRLLRRRRRRAVCPIARPGSFPFTEEAHFPSLVNSPPADGEAPTGNPAAVRQAELIGETLEHHAHVRLPRPRKGCMSEPGGPATGQAAISSGPTEAEER